ncbi:MAG: hypothetical protein PVSMB7_22110 [Chloroflexota bacterium]
MTFRDGAEFAILARTPATARVYRRAFAWTANVRAHDTNLGRAIVLQPFASLLGHDASYGQAEADVLTQAGFQTDILRNRDVTVASLKKLSDYSMVYMETHSGVLPDGDAIITVDETDAAPYASLLDDGSVMQAMVAGGGNILFLAIKANFIKLHLGQFPDSSLLFLNGCAVTNGPKFWNALRAHNVGTLVGWDNEVASSDDEAASAFVLHDLFLGNTVAHAVAAAIAHGLGASTQFSTAHLGYLGDGDNTLAKSLARATATPTLAATGTPTETPASTPTPTPAPVVKRFRVQVLRPLHARVKGTLRVKVTRRDTGSIVVKAKVSLDARGVGVPAVMTRKTGRAGIASFRNVRARRSGTVILRVAKSSFKSLKKALQLK